MARVMTLEETLRLIDQEVIGRVGCSANGRIYVVPITYVHDHGAVYGFSHEGLKMQMMRTNPSVCLEVERIRSIGSWETAIADGTFEELSGDEARRGAELIIRRLVTLMTDENSRERLHAAGEDDVRPIVYRIVLGEITGRAE